MLPRPAGKGAWEWKLFHWRGTGWAQAGSTDDLPWPLSQAILRLSMTFIGQTILETREQFLRVGSLGQKIKEEKIEADLLGHKEKATYMQVFLLPTFKQNILFVYLFIWLCQVLVVTWTPSWDMWKLVSSLIPWDWTWVPCIGSLKILATGPPGRSLCNYFYVYHPSVSLKILLHHGIK